ncbi:MAG: carbon-nitrogen hydrolase family protein [Myxococcaceae bacterium]|nr:carbon-nitrogen hydrolase family protein [Myxococcaceae bacterium]
MPLSVTVLEVPARFGAIEEQARWIDDALARTPPGEVLVLPESALTGYVSATGSFDLTPFAEPFEGRQLEALRRIAERAHTTVIGPIVERDGARCFNTEAVVAPDGAVLARYRKRHPWFPELWATPGDLPFPRLQLGGLACTLAVCFDVHFLAEEAADVLRQCDVLFFCSAWVDEEYDARPDRLGPLATEFGLFIVNANWGPGAPPVRGQGGSLVMSPAGKMLARTSARTHRLDLTLDPT